MVQLRLDAERTLTTGCAPLELLRSSPFVLTFEEAKFPRGVLHTLPLLHTHANTQSDDEQHRQRILLNRFDSQPKTNTTEPPLKPSGQTAAIMVELKG